MFLRINGVFFAFSMAIIQATSNKNPVKMAFYAVLTGFYPTKIQPNPTLVFAKLRVFQGVRGGDVWLCP